MQKSCFSTHALGAGGVPAAALDVTDSMVLVNVLLKDRGGKNNTG